MFKKLFNFFRLNVNNHIWKAWMWIAIATFTFQVILGVFLGMRTPSKIHIGIWGVWSIICYLNAYQSIFVARTIIKFKQFLNK